jgi:hypothetical protein
VHKTTGGGKRVGGHTRLEQDRNGATTTAATTESQHGTPDGLDCGRLTGRELTVAVAAGRGRAGQLSLGLAVLTLLLTR